MSDFVSRLFDEHGDLNRKIEKLTAFITSTEYNNLPEIDRKDLTEQLDHMRAYFIVLTRRVSRQCG